MSVNWGNLRLYSRVTIGLKSVAIISKWHFFGGSMKVWGTMNGTFVWLYLTKVAA